VAKADQNATIPDEPPQILEAAVALKLHSHVETGVSYLETAWLTPLHALINLLTGCSIF
jgi:hypothetical protein